jgi:hypothetical protein
MAKNKISIDDCMILSEAAERWNVSSDKITWRLKENEPGAWKIAMEMINKGWLKYHENKRTGRKSWIITVYAMSQWFGEEPKNKKLL